MASTVTLSARGKNGTTYQSWTLSPGCNISRDVQKDNMTFPIPLGSLIGLDMGFVSMNSVIVSGEMTYDHNSDKPITILEQINNYALYHATSYGETETADGKWTLILLDTSVTPNTTITYTGMPKMIHYDITAGEGNIVSYTITLDCTQDDI